MSDEKPESGRTEKVAEGQEKGVSLELRKLEKIAGERPKDLKQDISQSDLEQEERRLVDDVKIDSFSEQSRVNELQNRRGSLQHLNALQHSEKKLTPEQEKNEQLELIIANQAVTYHAYFPEIVRNMVDTMQKYEALRSITPVLSDDLVRAEGEARMYMKELSRSLEERVAFSNVLLIDRFLAQHKGDTGALLSKREEVLRSPFLSKESKEVLKGNAGKLWERVNALDQHIIEVLAGEKTIAGVKKGFFPQQLYLSLLQEKYKKMFDEEKRVVSDPNLKKSKSRYEALKKRVTAKPGIKSALDPDTRFLTPDEQEEFRNLQSQLQDRDKHLQDTADERHVFAREIVTITERLGYDQIQAAELSTIQHQFGDTFDFAGVSPSNPGSTPEAVRKAVAEHMEMRSNFHLGRMEAFLGDIENDVLHVGVAERVEDVTQKYGHPLLRKANHALTNIITRLVPTTLGLREQARTSLKQPLDEALGWPPGKEKWEELTPKEQETVLEKSQSVLDAINQFDQSKIENMQQTVGVVKSMPEASMYAGQEIAEPLPTDRVTEQNRDALISRYGGATVYRMLFDQMDADWGSAEQKSGFLGEYASFIDKVNMNVDIHIDVGEAVYQLQNTYDGFKKQLFYAALIVLGLGAIGGVALYKLSRPIMRAGWETTKFGVRMTGRALRLTGKGVIEAGKVIGRTANQVRELARTTRSLKPMPPVSAAEKLAEEAVKKSKIGRVLGPLGIVLTALDLRRIILRDARLEPLKEVDGINAAIELMEKKGNKTASRYGIEMGYLRGRLEAMQMEHNAESLLIALEKKYSGKNRQPDALKVRVEEMRKLARFHKQEFEHLFPITDYLVTDPQGTEGNVGINLRNIDDARARGLQYEESVSLRNIDLSAFKSPTKSGSEALPKKGTPSAIPAEEIARMMEGLKEAQANRPLNPERHFDDLRTMYETVLSDAADTLDEER